MSKNKIDFISFELNNEVKQLLYNEIDNINYYKVFRTHLYESFHVVLENYLKKPPSKTDKFAFVLLLTYSKKQIEAFTSISELNINTIMNSDKSDFQIKRIIRSNYDNVTNQTCICSQIIENIYEVENKHTNINFRIGCECIKRYKIVSRDELNVFCKETKMLKKKQKENNKEIEEGKPIGYYEELRKKEIQVKDKNKHDNLLKKEKKEKQINIQIEQGFKKYKKCVLCGKDGLYNSNDLSMCNKCLNSNNKKYLKKLNKEIIKTKRKYVQDECCECGEHFIYNCNNYDIKYLCDKCNLLKKVIECTLCENIYICDKSMISETCDICDLQQKICKDCNHTYISKEPTTIRCKKCQYLFANKLSIIKCQDCSINIEIKANETWKKFCSDCFKNNLINTTCSECSETFRKLSYEIWRKICINCYRNKKYSEM